MKGLSALSGADGGGGRRAPTPCAATGEDAPTPGDPSWGDDLRGTYTYLLSVPKPIIGAINGAVAGMGVPIVLSCDIRFMNEAAVLTTSFAQRGLVAEWGLSWLLTRLVGPPTPSTCCTRRARSRATRPPASASSTGPCPPRTC